MVPRNIPVKSETSAAAIDDWPSTETLARRNTTTEKNSTVEMERAKRANGGAKKARKSALTSPPKADDMMARPSAYCVWPWRLIRYPSHVVGTFMGSPGMLKRIPVIEPPKTPPQ